VDCVDASKCWATGSYQIGSGESQAAIYKTLVEGWNGKTLVRRSES
jgi:hypothetical protein